MEYGMKVSIEKVERGDGFSLTGTPSYALIGDDDDIDFVSGFEELNELEETFDPIVEDDYDGKGTIELLYFGKIEDRHEASDFEGEYLAPMSDDGIALMSEEEVN